MNGGSSRKSKIIFLSGGTLIGLALCFFIFQPYLNSILGAGLLAILIHPLFRELKQRTRKPSLAAILSLLILIAVVAIPVWLLIVMVRGELISTYVWLKTNTAAQNGWPSAFSQWADTLASWVGVHIGVDPDTIRSEALARINQAAAFFLSKTADALGNVSSGVVSTVIMLFTLFFLLRDGQKLIRHGVKLIPLSDDEIDLLLHRFAVAVQANVAGIIAVAGVQSALLGLAFWVLGIPSPILWAFVAAICSVIPIGGAALVWVPGAIYLFATHSVLKGVLLLAWGTGVISTSDNIVRPWILSERVNLTPVLILFALLGGVQLFGLIGVFLGPIILSVTVTFASMLIAQWRGKSLKELATSGRDHSPD